MHIKTCCRSSKQPVWVSLLLNALQRAAWMSAACMSPFWHALVPCLQPGTARALAISRLGRIPCKPSVCGKPWPQAGLDKLLMWQTPCTRSCALPRPAGGLPASRSPSTSSHHPVAAEQRPRARVAPPGQAAGSGGRDSTAAGQRDATTCQVGRLASTAVCLACGWHICHCCHHLCPASGGPHPGHTPQHVQAVSPSCRVSSTARSPGHAEPMDVACRSSLPGGRPRPGGPSSRSSAPPSRPLSRPSTRPPSRPTSRGLSPSSRRADSPAASRRASGGSAFSTSVAACCHPNCPICAQRFCLPEHLLSIASQRCAASQP